MQCVFSTAVTEFFNNNELILQRFKKCILVELQNVSNTKGCNGPSDFSVGILEHTVVQTSLVSAVKVK